jgi:small GTP-binding protein
LSQIIIVGDAETGKTSLWNRMISDQFSLEYKPTVGVQFNQSNVPCSDGIIVLQFWDLSGGSQYLAITRRYYWCEIAILTIDLSRLDTIDRIYQEIKSIRCDYNNILLVGTKYDLKCEQNIQQIADLCSEYNIKYVECSSKSCPLSIKRLHRIISDIAREIYSMKAKR